MDTPESVRRMAMVVYMEFVDPEELAGIPDRLLLASEMFERYANLLEIKERQNQDVIFY